MIKNLIFDLGNVLVGVDFERFERLSISTGIHEKRLDSFFGIKNRRAYESSKLTTSEFMDKAYLLLGCKISKVRLRLLFEDMFFEMTDMKRFLSRISKSGKYKIYLLSNTNPLHFNYIRKKFDYINLVDKFILSYKLKMVKPDKRIYRTVLKKYKLNPDETLFIDDLKENCKAAEKFGIHTVCFKNYMSFIKQFNKFTAIT